MNVNKPNINLNVFSDNSRKVFGLVIILLIIGLSIYPILSASNDLLTRFAIGLKGYELISDYIVPLEINWVVSILRFLGVNAFASGDYILIREGSDKLIEVIWNCVGWQSMIMFLVTVFIGFQKRFKFILKVKALVFGMFGTFLVNIFRIVIVILVFRGLGDGVGSVVHEYGALFTNTLWLFFFWWFSFRFILEGE